MIADNWRTLAITSVTDPASAAQVLLRLNPGRDVLWLGLALAVVLNTMLYALSQLIPGYSQTPMPGMPSSAIGYGGIVGGGLILTIFAVYRVGRMMGGQGSFDDVMILMVWMQFLRVAAQFAALVLALTVPFLSVLLVFVATIIGVFIFLHFINQAHRLGSLWNAAGVLIASVFAMAIALIILLSLVGGPIPGAYPNV